MIDYVTNPYNEKADRVVRGLYSMEKIFDDLDVCFRYYSLISLE